MALIILHKLQSTDLSGTAHLELHVIDQASVQPLLQLTSIIGA